MAASKAQRAWDELNERQRTYLRALYTEDQGLEAEHQRNGALGRFSRAPASVWRRIYLSGAYAPTPRALRSLGVWESGAGSTLVALADRGLIERGTTDAWESFALLTRAGRAAARAGLGIGPAQRKEPWELSEWLWRELAKVAGADEEGLPSGELFGSAGLYLVEGHTTRGNRPYLAVRSTHVEYTPRDHNGKPYPYNSTREVRRYVFTEAGRAHYVEHGPAYREWYPEIDAPELDVEVPPVEVGGLGPTRVRRAP
ncbi:hypothetical protein [Streptomyces anulatus]|uniref:hypothetical protein n=1 Tax=Streptomyces anulatus TaxID=1892 RepID=UPI00367546C3